jgi:ActR/RegA family two-component response regulator
MGILSFIKRKLGYKSSNIVPTKTPSDLSLGHKKFSLNDIAIKDICSSSGSKNIIIMDDDHFTTYVLEQALHSLSQLKYSEEATNEIITLAKQKNMDAQTIKKIQETIDAFNIEDFNITIFNDDKCGFEVTKSLNNTNCSVEYAILDVVLGGIVLDEENDKFLFIDGLDVCTELKKKYPNCKVLINTGCPLEDSREGVKAKKLSKKYPDIMYYIKGINPIDRYIALLLLFAK